MYLWRMPFSGMWCRVDLVWTDVSEERIASIFRIEKSAFNEPAWAGGYSLLHLLTLVPRTRNFLPWRCRRYGATSQKTAFFIVTAVKTSNLTDVTLFSIEFVRCADEWCWSICSGVRFVVQKDFWDIPDLQSRHQVYLKWNFWVKPESLDWRHLFLT
jgi:hypothetical protein